jgi:hypothetical protein
LCLKLKLGSARSLRKTSEDEEDFAENIGSGDGLERISVLFREF